ncbi:hypothetical protein LJB95_03475 [Paludibacteraceae bacterium OttesenSCG-928-F17]|nr:hypothetical protein [Paludibacteraceae bacterium OttesenSCG-928-F17]
MKKNYVCILLISLLGFTSCQKEELPDTSTKTSLTKEEAFQNLAREINRLNSDFFPKQKYFDYYSDINNYPTDDAKKVRWTGSMDDFHYAATGTYGGAHLGVRIAGPNGGLIGILVGGIIGAISGSVEWVRETTPNNPSTPTPTPYPGKGLPPPYIVRTEDPINFKTIDIREKTGDYELEFSTIFDPTISFTDGANRVLRLETAEDIGKFHNHIIQRLYLRSSEYIFSTSMDQIIDVVFEELEDMGFCISMPASFKEQMKFHILDIDPELSLEENGIPYDIALILDTYFENASLLTTYDAIEYTRQFNNLVLSSEIPEEYSLMIRAALSVAANSKALWNLNLPDPDEEDQLFIVYDYRGDWHLGDIGMVESYANIGKHVWGVPQIQEGIITKIFFYRDYAEGWKHLYLDLGMASIAIPVLHNRTLTDPFSGRSIRILNTRFHIEDDPEENVFAVVFDYP